MPFLRPGMASEEGRNPLEKGGGAGNGSYARIIAAKGVALISTGDGDQKGFPARTCPNCGMAVVEGEFCPDCGVKVSPPPSPAESGEDRELRMKVVYLAPDELTAITLEKVLEAEDVESWIQSIQVPYYDGLIGMVEGYWGRVLVLEDQETKARRIIEEYLRNLGPGMH